MTIFNKQTTPSTRIQRKVPSCNKQLTINNSWTNYFPSFDDKMDFPAFFNEFKRFYQVTLSFRTFHHRRIDASTEMQLHYLELVSNMSYQQCLYLFQNDCKNFVQAIIICLLITYELEIKHRQIIFFKSRELLSSCEPAQLLKGAFKKDFFKTPSILIIQLTTSAYPEYFYNLAKPNFFIASFDLSYDKLVNQLSETHNGDRSGLKVNRLEFLDKLNRKINAYFHKINTQLARSGVETKPDEVKNEYQDFCEDKIIELTNKMTNLELENYDLEKKLNEKITTNAKQQEIINYYKLYLGKYETHVSNLTLELEESNALVDYYYNENEARGMAIDQPDNLFLEELDQIYLQLQKLSKKYLHYNKTKVNKNESSTDNAPILQTESPKTSEINFGNVIHELQAKLETRNKQKYDNEINLTLIQTADDFDDYLFVQN